MKKENLIVPYLMYLAEKGKTYSECKQISKKLYRMTVKEISDYIENKKEYV